MPASVLATRRHRAHGEGSIRKRADGRWEARLSLANGKRRSFFGKTQREVQQKLLKARHDQANGLLVSGPDQTVGQFLGTWVEGTARLRVKQRTYTSYRQLIHNHLIPALGRLHLTKLAPPHLTHFYQVKLETGLSARTVLHCHRVLHSALVDALRWGLISRNVCDMVTPPRAARHEFTVLTIAQAQHLLVGAQTEPLGSLYILALLTGARLGELLALHWDVVDWRQRTIQIRGTLYRGEVFLPKTAKSRRTIALAPAAYAALKRQRTQQVQARLAAGGVWQDTGFIFTSTAGTPLDEANARHAFTAALGRMGLPRIRFHDLRHSFATFMLAQGEPIKTVQDALGHAAAATTLDVYGHVLAGAQRAAVNRLGAVLQK